MSASTSRRYPVELRERAVRMVAEIRDQHESEWAAMGKIAELHGIGTPETVRKWCRQAEVGAGARPGVTSEDSAELKRLKRENAELKCANAILEGGIGFLAAPNSTGNRTDGRVHRRSRRAIDAYARRILGWSVATTMTSQLALDAVDRGGLDPSSATARDLPGLIAHHPHGVQYLSVDAAAIKPPPAPSDRPMTVSRI